MKNRNIYKILQERFGDPIGYYAGDAPAGVRDNRQMRCPTCGTEDCECQHSLKEASEVCKECGMMEVEGSCGCTHEMKEEKRKRVMGKYTRAAKSRKKTKAPR